MSSDLPIDLPAEASIEIAPYDAAWPARFAQERDQLMALLAPWLAGRIEHIGSTSVPGLDAKPVIDMMAPVVSLEASREAIARLAAAGYCHAPYKADQMHWFCKPSPAFRTHHLHLVPIGSPLWRERLQFRDALRSDGDLRQAYAALKHALARRYATDREAYTEAKTPFIRQVLG